jgi:WD40 repeat protein
LPAEADPGNQKHRVDLYGDPLPPGAIARMGTGRFRHGGPVNSIAFSPDGKLLASGGNDGTTSLWEVATGKELHRIEGRNGECVFVTFSPDGSILAFAGRWDTRIGLLEIPTKKVILQFGWHPQTVTSIVFSPDGKTLSMSPKVC